MGAGAQDGTTRAGSHFLPSWQDHGPPRLLTQGAPLSRSAGEGRGVRVSRDNIDAIGEIQPMPRAMEPAEIERALAPVLPKVEKPGRYTGGELNQLVKDWDVVPTRVALVFPDVYDLGMSNLGLAVLYDILNRQPGVLAERVFAPWPDMEAALRRDGIPLFSLETKHALRDFDLIGVSLPYEPLYTNTLNLLDLGGVPLRTADHRRDDPVVIGGGHATYNPEPMAEFLDAFAIGEGEDLILEVVAAVRSWRESGQERAALHHSLARLWGVYVPSLYHAQYAADGSLERTEPP